MKDYAAEYTVCHLAGC